MPGITAQHGPRFCSYSTGRRDLDCTCACLASLCGPSKNAWIGYYNVASLPVDPHKHSRALPRSLAMANALPSTSSRLANITKWLTNDQIVSTDSDSTDLEEVRALAARLGQEHAIWRRLASNTAQQMPHAKLRATLAVLASCSHQTAAREDVARLHAAAADWIKDALVQPPSKPPSSTQLSVARAVIRGRVLHGCSRQLAGLADRIAGASGQLLQPPTPDQLAPVVGATDAREQSTRPPQSTIGPPEGVALCTTASTVTSLLSKLTALSARCPPITAEGAEDDFEGGFYVYTSSGGSSEDGEREGSGGGSSLAGEVGRVLHGKQQLCRGASSETAGSADSKQEGLSGDKRRGASEQQEQGAAGSGRDEAHPSSWVLELVSCVSASAVLEHAARAVQLAGMKVEQQVLQQEEQQPHDHQQRTEALREYAGSLQDCAVAVVRAYHGLSGLTRSLDFLDGKGSEAPDGAKASAAFDDSLAPGERAPLRAQPHALDALHTSLLRRALSGPCVRHLVLRMGLRTLCAMDGGEDYGLTQVAAAQWLPLVARQWPSGDQSLPLQQQRHFFLLSGLPLLNLLTLLAMSPCDPDAEPPCRGTRLRLTMRVARAVVMAARWLEVPVPAGCGDNIVRYAMTPGDAGEVAVQALHFAWRHMPPPGARGGSRCRAVLREWAALVGEVAGSALVPSMEDKTAYRLGLLLGAHPDLLRPAAANDLSALASGGHLLSGLEALVRQLAAEGQGQGTGTGGSEASTSAASSTQPDTHVPTRAGTVVKALMQKDCLKDLMLLMREDDEHLAAGQGDGEGAGTHGRGQEAREAGSGPGGGPRCAASLAVALGKLLWRCQGRLAEGIAECCSVYGASQHRDCAMQVLCGLHDVCVEGDRDTWHSTRAGRVADNGGADGAGEQQQRNRDRRLWVCTYGAWRWLPGMACLAHRITAAGEVPLNTENIAALVWHPLLLWVKRLCMYLLFLDLPCTPEEAMYRTPLSRVRTAGGSSDSSGGSCRGCGRLARRCRCWREFLLHDVGVVEVVGLALRVLAPELMTLVEEEEANIEMLWMFADVVVLVAATFPDEVGRATAWEPTAGGAGSWTGSCSRGGSSSGSSRKGKSSGAGSSGGPSYGAAESTSLWPRQTLCKFSVFARQWDEGELVGQGLQLLAFWGKADRQAGPSIEQWKELQEKALEVAYDAHSASEIWDVTRLPSLHELRGFLRLCSNPRCVVLPTPGLSEAAAAAAAERGLEACPAGCGAAWYCCRECREEHWREGHGAACRGGGSRGGASKPS